MALSDPVADFLTRIRNASRARKRFCDVSWSKLKQNIAEILKEQGFVDNVLIKVDENKRGVIRVFLKYNESRTPVIQGLQRISRPGLRQYVGYEEIPMFFGGLGVSIVSTSQGVMAGIDAKKRQIGGELLCKIW